MEKINYISEKQAVFLYENLLRKSNADEVVSGAAINILFRIFTSQEIAMRGITTSQYLHSCSLHNKHIEINVPIIVKNAPPKNKVYNTTSEHLYFLKSFKNSRIAVPTNVVFKECKGLDDVFKCYYVDEKNISVIVQNSLISHVSNIIPDDKKTMHIFELKRRIDAISEFYQSLQLENSTTEGHFILINILLLLFNSKEFNKAVTPERLLLMQSYIFDELQEFDEDNRYKVSFHNTYLRDDSICSLFEFRIISGFFRAFNCMSLKNKKTLVDIFNEYSQK